MKNIFHKKRITATLIISAVILTVDMMPIMAQTTPASGNPSKANSSNERSTSGKKMQANMDETFIRKASEGNMAEVELGKMALQKAASQEVKDFAQQMIDHHTKANDQLMGITSGMASTTSSSTRDQNVPATGDNSGNAGMSTNKKSGNTGSGSVSSNPGNVADKTTQQGNASDDANMNDNDQQTNGSISSPTNDNTVQGNNESNTRTSNPNRNISDGTGGGGSGANSGGTTSNTSTGRVSGTDMNKQPTDNTGNTGTGGQAGIRSNDGSLGSTGDNPVDMSRESVNSKTIVENPVTTLSPEHEAVKSKLAGLSGEAFDREYVQVMVKDHAKTIELFEAQIEKGQNTEIVTFAKNGLPMIRQHYQKAQVLSRGK